MKQLYRSRDNKVLAGVCGGLATYFNVDSKIIRIIFILLVLPGGAPGIVPYALLWLFIPKQPRS